MFPTPRVEWASVEQTHVRSGEDEPVREAVHLDRHAGLERDLEDAVEVERVLRPVVEDPPLRVREARCCRMPHRLEHALGDRLPARTLPRVQADLQPVELGEHVVGQVERAIREDVALAPAQDSKRRQLLVRGRDLLRLPPDPVRVSTTRTAFVWSQIARYA